jgi:hypothetical protein
MDEHLSHHRPGDGHLVGILGTRAHDRGSDTNGIISTQLETHGTLEKIQECYGIIYYDSHRLVGTV